MKRVLIAAGLLLPPLLVGCGREAPPQRVTAGSPAPAFQALTLAGDTLSLASLRGRPVLLNLWATWCAPCRRETPYLQRLHERYERFGLHVLGVSTDSRGALEDVEAFLEEFGVTYQVLHDPDGRSMDLFYAIGLPATYLIDSDGTVLGAWLGEVREGDRDFEDVLEDAVRRAAEASGAIS